MWIVSTNVVQAGSKLEGSLQCRLESRELAAADKGTEVIDAGLDLPGGIDSRESLLPVDLHQREVPERSHLPVRFRELNTTLRVEQVQGFECGIRGTKFDAFCDFAQVEIAQHLRPFAEKPFHSSMEIACFVENDQLPARIEDPVDAGFFRKSRERLRHKGLPIVVDGMERELHAVIIESYELSVLSFELQTQRLDGFGGQYELNFTLAVLHREGLRNVDLLRKIDDAVDALARWNLSIHEVLDT